MQPRSGRVELDVGGLGEGGTYPGVDDLAPHSFSTVASAEPLVVSFTSVGVEDTLRNVRESGEFVVCRPAR
jgi:flavin reductase (DIM6/NTAB) family NADH-FMN oxidoreductase RutF